MALESSPLPDGTRGSRWRGGFGECDVEDGAVLVPPDGFLISTVDLAGASARDDAISGSIPPAAMFRMAATGTAVGMDSSSYAGVGCSGLCSWAGSSGGGRGGGSGGGGDRRGRLAVGDDGAVRSNGCFGGSGYRLAWGGIGASIKLAMDGDALALVYRGAGCLGGVADRVCTLLYKIRGE